jgi:hypothetical protein
VRVGGQGWSLALLAVAVGLTWWSPAAQASKVPVVTVRAGKPTELAFALSRSSGLPPGAVTFRVRNAGLAPHGFKICATPISGPASKPVLKNSCRGTATRLLKPGQSARLTVRLAKRGEYEYLSPLPGEARRGMKGLLGVGVTVESPSSQSSVTTVGSPTTTETTTTTATVTTTSTATETTTTVPTTTTAGGGGMFGQT